MTTDTQDFARDQWGTKLGFILAAMGSAIGLGNIWRYPYVVYDNGGGAFLIPYFVALITAGLPILILEYSLGHRYKQGAPATFHAISKRWEWLGWWQAAISFMIATYYVVILGWCLSFICTPSARSGARTPGPSSSGSTSRPPPARRPRGSGRSAASSGRSSSPRRSRG